MYGFNQHVYDYKAHLEMEALKAKFVEAVKSPLYQYARFRQNCVWAYHQDDKSPTGVVLACGMPDVDFADQMIREIRNNSPLSPTEGLKSSGAYLGV